MKCLLAILIAGTLIAADKGQISGIVPAPDPASANTNTVVAALRELEAQVR
jgi:hypothetical protein